MTPSSPPLTPKRHLYPIERVYSFFTMVLASAELDARIEDPDAVLEDDQIIMSFSGNCASDQLQVGNLRAFLKSVDELLLELQTDEP